MTDDGSAVCTLCGFGRGIDSDVTHAAGLSSAMEFALHFVAMHPDIPSTRVNDYVAIASYPDPGDSEPWTRPKWKTP